VQSLHSSHVPAHGAATQHSNGGHSSTLFGATTQHNNGDHSSTFVAATQHSNGGHRSTFGAATQRSNGGHSSTFDATTRLASVYTCVDRFIDRGTLKTERLLGQSAQSGLALLREVMGLVARRGWLRGAVSLSQRPLCPHSSLTADMCSGQRWPACGWLNVSQPSVTCGPCSANCMAAWNACMVSACAHVRSALVSLTRRGR
jgi:hypothetical protein